MAKIRNMNELREVSLDILEDLRSGKISHEEAGVASKVVEGVLSNVRTQAVYAKMCGRDPNIPFMGDCLGDMSLKTIQLRSELEDQGLLLEQLPVVKKKRKSQNDD